MRLDENTNVYVKIDNDDELKLFCDFINKHYPNKFYWYSDSLTPNFQRKRITIEYMKKFLFNYKAILNIDCSEFVFKFGMSAGGTIMSVYDIIGYDNNKPTIPDWLKC